MANTIEYVVWGIPAGQAHETVLVSRIETRERADEWVAFVENDGCTSVRIQELDLAEPPDFIAAILS